MSVELELDRPGTLSKPGPLGRGVRLVFGVGCAWLAYRMVTYPTQLVRTSWPDDIELWLWIVFGFSVFPYVVNIGYSLNWKRWPQAALVVLAAGAGVIGLARYGSFWAPPLGWLLTVWFVYLYGHLGISFLLAGVLGTPGCEMRSIPHLWTIVTGNDTAEHYCPGLLGRVDRWEENLKRKA